MRFSAVVVVSVLAVGCSGEAPTGSAGRSLVIRLETPHQDDGAVLFDVAGPAIDSITGDPARVFVHTTNQGATVIAAGSIQRGPLVRVWSRQADQPARFSATIRQVAARGSYAQRPIDAYRLTVSAE